MIATIIVASLSGCLFRRSNWLLFVYRSLYNVNNILGVSRLGVAAFVISGAYLANRVMDQLVSVVSYLHCYRHLFDHQYLGSYRYTFRS